MNAAEWEQLQHVVHTAAELPGAEREAYLAGIYGEDTGSLGQARKVLRAYCETGHFLEEAVSAAAVAQVNHRIDLAHGDRIDRYRVTAVLGQGGMGTVYCAQRSDEQFRQSVAIKLVRVGPGANEELFARFRVERQILAKLNHPGIARLLDGGITSEGLPYLVMEYVEGITLDQHLATAETPLAARLDLFLKICAAIQYAHQNLIVHRDLKPRNVMIAQDGSPKLLDFGIAKILGSGLAGETIVYTRLAERLMTPEYASPEQIRGETITTATDIYGLGVLLYEMLTGSRPFQCGTKSAVEFEKLICETQPAAPSTAGVEATKAKKAGKQHTDLDRVVLKALHKEPGRRYSSAAEFGADVQRYLGGFPVIARPDSFGYRTRRFVTRHSLAVVAAALVLLVVIGLSGNAAIQAKRARREAASAEAVSQYLVGLFDFTRPDATQGRSVSAREILDRGTEQLKRTGTDSLRSRRAYSLNWVLSITSSARSIKPLLSSPSLSSF